MLSIDSAFEAYLNGDIDGWDLQDVVEDHGFKGFTVTMDLKLIVYKEDASDPKQQTDEIEYC